MSSEHQRMGRMTSNVPNIIYADLPYDIMAAIFEVYKVLGPGFFEPIYEKALIKELESRGIKVETQKLIDLMYKNRKIGIHRLDLVVDNKVVIELKQ